MYTFQHVMYHFEMIGTWISTKHNQKHGLNTTLNKQNNNDLMKLNYLCVFNKLSALNSTFDCK